MMTIYKIEQVSLEIMKLSSSSGLAFFIRTSYLKVVKPEEIVVDTEFFDEKETDIIDSAMSFSVESKAMEYLARAEQSRFNLTQKLLKKSFEKKYIDSALDYLESKKYLSDYRFSRAWLNTRKIDHYEGKSKLQNELLCRGINKEIANQAIKEFFEENNEDEICLKAYEKFKRKGKPLEKIKEGLVKAGFSYKMIKETVENEIE